MAMKRYSTFPEASQQEFQHQIQITKMTINLVLDLFKQSLINPVNNWKDSVKKGAGDFLEIFLNSLSSVLKTISCVPRIEKNTLLGEKRNSPKWK